MNALYRFVTLLLGACGVLKREEQPPGPQKILVDFSCRGQARPVAIQRDLPFGRATRVVRHILMDANFQPEMFKWRFGPEDFDDFSFVTHNVRNAEYEDKQYALWVGKRNFRSFSKEALRSPSYTQSSIEREMAEREKPREPSILEAEGIITPRSKPGPRRNSYSLADDAELKPYVPERKDK